MQHLGSIDDDDCTAELKLLNYSARIAGVPNCWEYRESDPTSPSDPTFPYDYNMKPTTKHLSQQISGQRMPDPPLILAKFKHTGVVTVLVSIEIKEDVTFKSFVRGYMHRHR